MKEKSHTEKLLEYLLPRLTESFASANINFLFGLFSKKYVISCQV